MVKNVHKNKAAIRKITLISLLMLFLSTFPLCCTVTQARDKALLAKEKVVVFGTLWCGYCKKTQEYLNSIHVQYTFYDIEHSKIGKQKYEALQGRGIPIIVIGRQKIEGFDPHTIKNALKDNGYFN